ncbi:hypothetical protein [Spirosoma litoris]
MKKQNYIILEAHCPKVLLNSIATLKADGYTVLATSASPKICQLGRTRLYVQAMMRVCIC